MAKSAADRAMDAVDTLIGDLKTSATRLGPHAIDAARAAVRVDAANSVISGTVGAVVLIGGAIGAAWCWNHMPAAPDCSALGREAAWWCGERAKETRIWYQIGVGVFGVLGISGWFSLYSKLFNAWTWVALRNPDAWIANEVLDRFINPPTDD